MPIKSGIKCGFKWVLRAYTLSSHFVSTLCRIHFVPSLRPYALSKAKDGAAGGISAQVFSSSSSSPGTAGTAGTAGTTGGCRPIPTTMPYYWREPAAEAPYCTLYARLVTQRGALHAQAVFARNRPHFLPRDLARADEETAKELEKPRSAAAMERWSEKAPTARPIPA